MKKTQHNFFLSVYDYMTDILSLAVYYMNLHKAFCISLAVVVVHSVLSAVAQNKSVQASHFSESRKQEVKYSHLTQTTTNTNFWSTAALELIHAVHVL